MLRCSAGTTIVGRQDGRIGYFPCLYLVVLDAGISSGIQFAHLLVSVLARSTFALLGIPGTQGAELLVADQQPGFLRLGGNRVSPAALRLDFCQLPNRSLAGPHRGSA
jgi:xanthosine utilization system XapX-like protein